MAKFLPLPDGTQLRVPEGMPEDEAMRRARKAFPDLFPAKSGLGAAFSQGLEGLASTARTAYGAVTGSPEEAARAAMERGEDIKRKYAEQVSLDKVKQAYEEQGLLSAAKEVARQAPAAIMEQLPNIGESLAGARAGATLGGMAGPQGALIGGIGGALVPSLIHQFGSNIERQAQVQKEAGQPLNIDRTAALGAAVPQAGLEVAGNFIPFGGKIVSKLTGIPEKAFFSKMAGNAEKIANERLLTTLAKGTATGVLAEVPTEIAQQMLERAQAGLSLTDKEAMAEYGQTAYQVGLLGPLGIAGRVSEKSAARDELEDKRKAEAKAAADAAEAERNKPENLLRLDSEFQAAKAQMQALQAAAKKPGKDATEEQMAAHEQAKTAFNDFRFNTFNPLKAEYDQRAPQIAKLKAQQQAETEARYQDLETQGAQMQPAMTAPVPNAPPQLNLPRLMEQHDLLRSQQEEIFSKMSASPQAFQQLEPQYAQLQTRLTDIGKLIEENGGTTETPERFEAQAKATLAALDKKIESANKAFATAMDPNNRDVDAGKKAAEQIAKLNAEREKTSKDLEQRRAVLAEKVAGLEQRGQTRELFGEMPEQPEAVGLKYVTYPKHEGKDTPLPKKPTEAIQPFDAGPKEAAPVTELQTSTQQTENKPSLMDNKTLDIFSEENRIRTAIANNDQATIARIAEAEDRRQRDERYAQADEQARRDQRLMEALEGRLNLGGKEGQDIEHKRVNYFEQHYDAKQQAAFKNGTSQETIERERLDADGKKVIGRNGLPIVDTIKLQDIWDKGGPAAVEFELIKDQIGAQRRKIETPQGNAKQSVLAQLEAIAKEHAELQAEINAGKAGPHAKRKLAALEKEFNKLVEKKIQPVRDEIDRIYSQLYKKATPENLGTKKVRALTAAEEKQERSAALREKALELGKETQAYKEYEAHQTGLLEKKKQQLGEDSPAIAKFTQHVEKLLEEKALELGKGTNEYQAILAKEIKARKEAGMVTPKVAVSRTARTAARINRGDVRKEAETSEKMRNLARDLGMEEQEYKTFNDNITKRYAALKAKYGAYDPAVIEFQKNMAEELNAKAIAIGKTTPEYKATLKEQTEYVKEALSQSKQEIPSKRTTQETRRIGVSRKEKPSSVAAEDKEAGEGKVLSKTAAKKVAKKINAKDGGTAYRMRETEGGTVDAKEAADFMEKVQSNLPENVKLVYAATPGKIPVKILKRLADEGVDPTEAMVQGAVFSDGTVLIVGDQHADLADLEETVAHELVGHYGIDTIIGTKRLQEFANKTDLLKLAEDVGGEALVREVQRVGANNLAMGRSEEVQKLQVLREIIAHTEEARVTESFREKAGRWMKELVGMVRAALRDMGFTKLTALSNSDVYYMLKQSRKAFNNKTIGPYRTADGQTAFRTRHDSSSSIFSREPSTVDKLMGNIMGLAGRVQFIDRYAALSEALKKGQDAGKISSLEATNAEYMLRFGEQRSMYAGQFLTNGRVQLVATKTPEGTTYTYESKKGVSLMNVAEALNEGGFENDTKAEDVLTIYEAGARAKQVGWDKLNFENPQTAKAEYDAVMAELNANQAQLDAVKKASKLYREYNAGLLDFLVETGAITKQKANELKSISYVPFYRTAGNGDVQLMIDKEHPVRIGNIKDEPQLQQLVGDNKHIMPIFSSSVQNTFMLTDMGLRNQAVKESCFALGKMGIASRVIKGSGPSGTDVVRFKVKGEDWHAIIDTDVYGIPAQLIVKGMEGIKTPMQAVLKLMGIPADILRKFVTRNPVYAVRQVVRDPLNAWLTTGTDATPVLSSMKELANMVAGRSDAERELMEAGAISSNVFSGDQRDMSKFLRDIAAGKSGWDKAMARLDTLALQGDAATRAVVYKDSLAKGMTKQQALLRTLESMNFSRRGVSPSMQALSVMIPFFNAQIQGLDVLYRAFTGNMPFSEQLKIKEKLIARGLMMAAGTAAYAMLMSDDEAYKRAKPEERYANWFVYVPGVDEPVRVPIPFELGYLFKALPEAVYNMAFNDEKASKAMGGMYKLLEQSNPFSLPQAVKPLTEAVLGKSFYGGDIESAREQGILPTERYRASTTELSKLLGQVTGQVGVSPITIDYLIRGYTGPLGIALVSLANPLLNTQVKADVAEPSLKASKTPFIGGLFQPVEGRGTLDEAYDRMQEIKQTKNTYNKMVEEGNRAEAKAFAQEHANTLALASTSGAVYKYLGEIAKQERETIAAPKMSTEEKDRRLERLDKMKTDYARKFIALSDKTTPQ